MTELSDLFEPVPRSAVDINSAEKTVPHSRTEAVMIGESYAVQTGRGGVIGCISEMLPSVAIWRRGERGLRSWISLLTREWRHSAPWR